MRARKLKFSNSTRPPVRVGQSKFPLPPRLQEFLRGFLSARKSVDKKGVGGSAIGAFPAEVGGGAEIRGRREA
jgi:hypothetical protein